MLTTAGAARSTASAYEFTAGVAGTAMGATVVAGADPAGEGRLAAVSMGSGRGAATRRATSSGRIMTTTKAAASPTTADRTTKVTIRKTGRIKFSSWGGAFSAFPHVYNA